MPRDLMVSAREEARLDRAALERLYVKLEKPMFNVVYRWLWNAADAREVVQDAFLRVWKARERVELETVTPLLYKTALNLAANRRRAAKVRRFFGLEELEAAPSNERRTDEQLEHEQKKKRVREAIDSLPERLREVIVMTEIAEMPYEEIGEVLGIPAGTVGSRRHAALKALAEKLGPIDGVET
ncbi:MAG TPA: RNA polymerase sigma factor [Labilithrix sp.]